MENVNWEEQRTREEARMYGKIIQAKLSTAISLASALPSSTHLRKN